MSATQEYVDQVEWVSFGDTAKGYTLSALAEMQQAKWTASGHSGGDPHWPSPAPRVAKDHECPHCFRQRHPEPLTQRQAQMCDNHLFLPGYDAALDESPGVCIGADYEGPVERERVAQQSAPPAAPNLPPELLASLLAAKMKEKKDAQEGS